MRYKSLLMLIIATATVSLVAQSGFSQCNRSSGNPGQPFPGGTYNPRGEIVPYPSQPYPPNPAVESALDVTASVEPGAGDELAGQEFGSPSGGFYNVVVEHPSGSGELNVRSYSDRDEADQHVQRLSQRFWVAYTDSENQRGYREAKSAGDITGIANEIRAAGNQVKGAFPVVARIARPQDTSLEQLLGDEPVAPTTRPAQPVIEEALPVEEIEESADESQLAAIEGVWAAVARTADGELRTIELKLDSGGWARLSIPDGAGQTKTIERRAVVEDGQLKLRDGDQEMSLGELAQVESNQFVINRDDGQITFLRQ